MEAEKKPELEDLIDMTIAEMTTINADSDEYATRLSQLEKLIKLRPKKADRVSRDVLVTVAGNLILGVMIIGHERGHVIGKAFSLIMRPRTNPQ